MTTKQYACFIGVILFPTYCLYGESPSTLPADLIIKRLSALPPNPTADDLDKAFGTKGEHQFSILCGEVIYRCLAYRLWEHHIRYYAVFKSEKLLKIIVPPPFEVEIIAKDGRKFERRKPWKPSDRIKQVLQSRTLDPNLSESIQSAQPTNSKSNLQPGLLILVPSLIFGAVTDKPSIKLYEKLEKKYDGRELKLGISADELLQLWGEPFKKIEKGSSVIEWVYGKENGPGAAGLAQWPWSMAALKNGKVVAVLSHEFVNEDLLKAGEPQMKDPLPCPRTNLTQ